MKKAEPIIIKRYHNRKYYSTALADYVNLPHIFNLFRRGIEVKIIHQPSGLDITQIVRKFKRVENIGSQDCLNCGRRFSPTNKFNRLCPTCKRY